jgi:hypothetical protein
MTTASAAPARTVDVLPVTESALASPAPILITERQIAFATAAAVPMPNRRSLWHRSTRPARRDCPRRYTYLENAVMGREMERL